MGGLSFTTEDSRLPTLDSELRRPALGLLYVVALFALGILEIVAGSFSPNATPTSLPNSGQMVSGRQTVAHDTFALAKVCRLIDGSWIEDVSDEIGGY